MKTSELKIKLFDALVAVKDNGPKDPYEGLCMAVANAAGHGHPIENLELDMLLDELMQSWPKATGSLNFPVPGTDGQDYLAAYLDRRANKESLWDPKTEYGRLRLELLDHCINKLNED